MVACLFCACRYLLLLLDSRHREHYYHRPPCCMYISAQDNLI